MIRSYMLKIRVFSFGTFLELAWHLQSTRSRRLVNGFRWFLVQNKAESLLVLFLLFPAQFRWVESNENFQWSKKLCFFLDQTPKMEANVLVDPCEKPPRISRNNEYTHILHPEKSKALLGVVAHQFSGQTEHLAMYSSGTSISASWTRNEPTYCRHAFFWNIVTIWGVDNILSIFKILLSDLDRII